MQSDRELLELAAKAAGLTAHRYCEPWKAMAQYDEVESGFFGRSWDPLTDDGDALRLAVRLEMQVCIGVRRIDATIVGDEDGQVFRGTEAKAGDICAATRRAIVLAAAEIGAQAHPKQHNDGGAVDG